tara:strand:+ start:323 stop:1408 length:1086 start_codon:yes stop_codon:yes gene_type:complete
MSNNNDYVIANDTGQEVRLDIQDAFQQLASNNFGTTPPANAAFEHQWFANGDTNKLMYKDASNNNNVANYFNLANLTGGIFVDQPSTFNGDVIFQGDDGSSNFQIYYDSSANLTKGALILKDETRISLGSDEDFILSHGLGFTFLGSNTNTPVYISGKTPNTNVAAIELRTAPSTGISEIAYEGYVDGGQHLYFDGGGTPKLKTTANGIEVTGSITATAQPACLLIDPVDTDITSTNEATPIKFNTQQTNVGCTVNTDKDRITVPSSGTYLISVCLSGIKTNATSDTDRILKILKNGNDAVNKDAFPRDPFGTSRNNESFSHTITMPLVLSANDYLELCFEGVDNALATVKFGYFSVTKLH